MKHLIALWLYTKLPEYFKDRIIPIGTEVMLEWGRLRAGTGRFLPVIDSLIAATAISCSLTLVTRNSKDFKSIPEIKLVNLWEE